MRKVYKRIKDMDMFGHVIQLNFNRKGELHRTFIGGFISVFIRSAMIMYFFWHLKTMFFMEDDNITSYNKMKDIINMGEVSYKKSDLMIFYTIRKQITTSPVYINDPEVKKHIRVHF